MQNVKDGTPWGLIAAVIITAGLWAGIGAIVGGWRGALMAGLVAGVCALTIIGLFADAGGHDKGRNNAGKT